MFRILFLLLPVVILTGCAEHIVPNNAEVSKLINRQLLATSAEKNPKLVNEDDVSDLVCTGNGSIALCRFQINGRKFKQTFGYSKFGWTGRSSVYTANNSSQS